MPSACAAFSPFTNGPPTVSQTVAGQIGYSLAPMIARGAMLGADQPVILHLLDIDMAKAALAGVKMELLDAAFPLLQGEKRLRFRSALFY